MSSACDCSRLGISGQEGWDDLVLVKDMIRFEADGFKVVVGLFVDGEEEKGCLEKGKEVSLNTTFLDMITLPFGSGHLYPLWVML